MEIIKSIYNLTEKIEGIIYLEVAFSDDIVEQFTLLPVLEDKIYMACTLINLNKVENVGVVQQPLEDGRPLDAPAAIGVLLK
jgi:hypothetical protein